jgi:transcriptional regulator with XRE-family HTH domain
MIKNDRQYRVTKAEVRKFEEAIFDLAQQPAPRGDLRLAELHRRALESQIEEMTSDVHEYESLKSGAMTEFGAKSLDDLPAVFVKARIALRMTHKSLAERLNIKEQQVQRWEANDYYGVSFENLKAIANALGVFLTQHFSIRHSEPAVLRETGVSYRVKSSRVKKEKKNSDDQ